jgi:hypothetical protein
MIELDHVPCISIGYSDSEANVSNPEMMKFNERPNAPIEAIRNAAQFVVCLRKAFDTYANADIPMAFEKAQYSICKIAIRAENETFCLLFKNVDYVFEILTEKRLSSGHIDCFH